MADDATECDIVEFSLSCESLRNRDWLSKSDPFVVLFVQARSAAAREAVPALLDFLRRYDAGCTDVPERLTCATGGSSAIWQYAWESETVWDDLSPRFVGKMRVPCALVDALNARFEIYDMDDYSAPLAKQDFLGALEVSVRELVDKRNGVYTLCDRKGRARASQGRMRVCADRYAYQLPAVARSTTIRVQFAASSGIEPGEKLFFTLSRAAPLAAAAAGGADDDEAAGWVQLHRSGALAAPQSKRDWAFQDASVRDDTLLAGEPGRFLRLELFYHRANGNHVRIGGTRTFTLRMLQDAALSGRQRLVPDSVSGAALRSADYTVDVTAEAELAADVARQSSGGVFSFSSSGHKRASSGSLSPLRSSARHANAEVLMVFRFGSFFWWPAKREMSLLRQMSARIVR